MSEKVLGAWKNLSKREKVLAGLAALSLVVYLTYMLVLEKTFMEVFSLRMKYLKQESEYQQMLVYHQKLEDLKKELTKLEKQLAKKQEDEKRLMEGLKARHHLDKLLYELQLTAKKMPLRLMNLELKTDVISKNKDFSVEAATVASASKPNVDTKQARSVKVDYIRNQIVLSYRAPYASALKYLLKLVDMPYAISFLFVEIKRTDFVDTSAAEAPGSAPKKSVAKLQAEGEVLLDTQIGMEVYYR